MEIDFTLLINANWEMAKKSSVKFWNK